MKDVEVPTSLYWKLRKKAERQGKTVEEYVEDLVKKQLRGGDLIGR